MFLDTMKEVPAVAKRRCVLVLDNASWQSEDTPLAYIEPLYLPPYSLTSIPSKDSGSTSKATFSQASSPSTARN
ncbi:MAG: hypothetical protein R3F31_25265 [Verrucomicrobiales bacterium]